MRITVGMPVHDCVNVTKLTVMSFLTEWEKANLDIHVDFVIVDNASNEETQQYFMDLQNFYFPKYQKIQPYLIRMDQNYGVSKSYNRIFDVFDKTNGEYCILINNDIVFSENWLSNLLDFIKDFPEAGVVSPHVIDNHVSEETRYQWFGDYRKGEIGPISRDWYQYVENIRASEKEIFDVGVHGCCTVITRACRDSVGGYDEGFKIGCWDDIDYSYRTMKAGYTLLTTHNSIIYHHGGSSQHYLTTKVGSNWWQEHNKQYFLRKYGLTDLGDAVCSRSLLWRHPKPGVNELVCL